MPTLLLCISAPMQSWGIQSHFSHRDTGREPSKSGILGLLCAALGRPRYHDISDLAGLKMGVRVDQAGIIQRDYHTAGEGGFYRVSGSIGHNTIPSERFYLSDAKFLVGLEGDDWQLLEKLYYALQRPQWFLFFGRKAFVPGERVWMKDGIHPSDILFTFGHVGWLGKSPTIPVNLTVFIEDETGEIVRNDQPISFKPRRFISRRIRRLSIPNPSYVEESK